MNSLKVIFDYDTWQEIFSSIKKNKVRTIITVIGVLWGIFIYITWSGSSNGLDNGFDKEFENIAMNSMFIWTQQTSMPYKGFKTGRRPRLKISDAEVLLNNVPEIPFIKTSGKNTATKINVVAIIAKVICFDPLYAATKDVSPFSIRV